ncbi:hypothetical protein D7Z54_32915 [Salibacterium salarium]|uniref:Uncharacterized protein n=1 Tax=Salibacterium salarium TaxID=284579 RepID=A0A3R9R7W2_9BACI|nr:hypothetical protein [Salibacterium salarium]RSL29134.1 hypothetical protein D7Z54_32915 [Salibacterium salarium]
MDYVEYTGFVAALFTATCSVGVAFCKRSVGEASVVVLGGVLLSGLLLAVSGVIPVADVLTEHISKINPKE